MKEVSLSDRIYKYLLAWKLKNPEHFTSGIELERLALEAGFKPSTSSRRARELQEEGVLEARYTDKGFVEYRATF